MTAARLSRGLKVSLSQLLRHCFLKLCLREQFLQLQVLFLQVFQLFRVPSFQATELVTPPVIGYLGDVEVPQHGSNITASGWDPVSFLDFANYLLWGVPFSSFVRHGYSLPANCRWLQDNSHNLLM